MATKESGQDVDYIELKAEFLNFKEEEVVCKFRFREPKPTEMERATKETQKNPSRGGKNLCLLMVDPAQKDELNDIFRKYPGVAITFSDEIYTRTGYGSLGK